MQKINSQDSEKRLKILHIPTSGINAGVISKFIINIMTDTVFAKHTDCYVVSPIAVNESLRDFFDKSGLSLVVMAGRKSNPFAYFFRLISYMRKHKFDLVHVHGSSAVMSIELLAAKLAGIKLRIAHSHNIACEHILLHKILLSAFFCLYTHAAACSSAAGKWLFGNRDFKVIYNGIELKKFYFSEESRDYIRNELGLTKDNFLLGCVGHFNRQKNHDFLLDIFYKIAQIDKGARLLLIGSGSLESKINEKVHNFNLDKKVFFIGNVSDVHRWMSAMDIFVLPSLFEGFSIVLAEAQANALVSFTSDSTPRTVALTSKVNYLPLNAGADIWAEEILNYKNYERQLSDKEKDSLSLFDIAEVSKEMYAYYLEISNRG